MSFLRVSKKADLPDPYIVITLGLSYPLESSRVPGKTEPYPGRGTTHIVIGSVEETVRYNQFDKSEAEEAFTNRKIWLILCTIAIFVVAILFYTNFQKEHTFTLANNGGIIKSEQIQPLFGTVKVSGDCDTDVVFTDIETGERYVVGYITSGVSEKIKLEKGKWYTVAGGGNLVIGPVSVRIE